MVFSGKVDFFLASAASAASPGGKRNNILAHIDVFLYRPIEKAPP